LTKPALQLMIAIILIALVVKMPTVFLSYAHDDNLVPAGMNGRGWVSFFDDSLGIELRERGMLDVKVWRDKRDFDPMDLVTNTLTDGVTGSDILLAVLSPLYVQKPYCRFELDGFIEKKSEGGNEFRNRILLVAKRPVLDAKYPDKIKGMGYVPFFENNRERAQDEPFYKGYGTTVAQQYWDSIQDVASRLEKSLADLAGVEIEKKRKQAGPAKGVAVYLSVPSSDLKDAHYSLRKELESQGCHVVPSDPWPNDPVAAEAHLRTAVASAQLSIHLLGAAPGSDQASGLSNLCRLQLDLAAQRADADFRRLIWLPEGAIATEETQKLLIEGLEKGDGLRALDELVRSGAESFKEVVRDELSRLVGAAAKPSRIYLMCDAVDEAEALALRPPLVEAGFEVELPEFAADGKVPPEEHQRCLRGCETVLAFWGKVTESRIRTMLEEVDGAVATFRQGTPFAARGLYLGAPESPRKANFASNYVDIILRDVTGFKLLRAIPKAHPRVGP
jgi:TIR domain